MLKCLALRVLCIKNWYCNVEQVRLLGLKKKMALNIVNQEICFY